MARIHGSGEAGRRGCSSPPSDGGAVGRPDRVGARIRADFNLQLEICDALETLADSLPSPGDMTLATMLADIAGPSWREHVRFQEDALFPALMSRRGGRDRDTFSEQVAVLMSEHGKCLDLMHELHELLRRFAAGQDADSALLGYLLRMSFDCRRSHIERERALVDPLVEGLPGSSQWTQLESWLVANAWPRFRTGP